VDPESPETMPFEQRRPVTVAPEEPALSRPRAAEAADDGKTMAVPRPRRRQPKQLDAGPLAADVDSFRLHLAAG
jgi:hypothetical protein